MALRIRIERTEVPRSASRRRALTLTAVTIVAGVLVTGVSYAYWTATGSGNAAVSSVTPTALSVASSSPVVSDLYPGKPAEALTFTVNNPNPYIVNVTSASVGAPTSSDSTNCPTTNLATVPAGPFAQNFDVPAGGSATGSVAGIVQMLGTAGNGCQGKTFTFSVSVTGNQK